jgi:hypothetical protein
MVPSRRKSKDKDHEWNMYAGISRNARYRGPGLAEEWRFFISRVASIYSGDMVSIGGDMVSIGGEQGSRCGADTARDRYPRVNCRL